MSHSIDCMLCRKTIHDPDAQGQLTLRSEGRTFYLCAACNEVRESPVRWGYIWCAVADEFGRLRDETGALTRERDEARAELERLKLSARLWADDIDAVSNAYRRGAEAMREACIAWARAPENDWEHLAHELGNMPIPEEP